MRTIELKISDDAYERFLNALEKFTEEEISIVEKNNNDRQIREYLEVELSNLKSGHSKLLTQAEFNRSLDQVV